MSIFESLKNAILGNHAHASAAATTPAPQTSPVAQPGAAAPTTPTIRAQAGSSASAPIAPAVPVNIETVLSQRAAQRPEKLNWQSSIVDLMKLVGLDPSLENRKSLAKELGYTGDMQDSASMNLWLHKEVMRKLAASGGKVPESLHH